MIRNEWLLNLNWNCMLPEGFSYFNDSRIILSLDYATAYNFIGRVITGYEKKVCILTENAAQALIAVQDELDSYHEGYRLKIFDAYRPTTAVLEFKNWSLDPQDQKMKSIFYPNISKSELFKAGYLAERSSHSRGSTVDLTIVDTHDNELEMGTIFDFFDETAFTETNEVSEKAKENRKFLLDIMHNNGFINYPLEWWHYTLKTEPFPDTYFDFPIR